MQSIDLLVARPSIHPTKRHPPQNLRLDLMVTRKCSFRHMCSIHVRIAMELPFLQQNFTGTDHPPCAWSSDGCFCPRMPSRMVLEQCRMSWKMRRKTVSCSLLRPHSGAFGGLGGTFWELGHPVQLGAAEGAGWYSGSWFRDHPAWWIS